MNPVLFIAERMFFSESGEKQMSRPAVKVAVAAIAVGIAVMVITVFVILGFKNEITRKVVGFGSHLQITNFDSNNTFEMRPIEVSDSMLDMLAGIDGVSSVSRFATKPGIIKTDGAFQGIVLKGCQLPGDSLSRFWQFFGENMVRGELPHSGRDVLISAALGRKLRLDVDSLFLCYFIQDNVRVRKYRVSGIYETGLTESDELFVIGDIADVQRLNQWADNMVSGIDLTVDNFSEINEVFDRVYLKVANRFDDEGNAYYVQNIIDLNPAIFSWLELLNMNVVIIVLLMLAVAGFNIISALLVIILGNINFIGVMKALGASNNFLREVFLLQSAFLIIVGTTIGNVLALGLCALQYLTHLIPLDAATYYVSYVPVSFEWGWWLLLNVGTILVSVAVLVAPSRIITSISPSEIIRYE